MQDFNLVQLSHLTDEDTETRNVLYHFDLKQVHTRVDGQVSQISGFLFLLGQIIKLHQNVFFLSLANVCSSGIGQLIIQATHVFYVPFLKHRIF